MAQKIEEIVKQVLDYHWAGYSGTAEKDDDEFVVILTPLASENPDKIAMGDEPTGFSKVSWKEAIEDLAKEFPPYTPLDKIGGKFDQHFGS